MKRESWAAATAALALFAVGSLWFAVKAPELADPAPLKTAGPDVGALARIAAPNHFYAPGRDEALFAAAAAHPVFRPDRQPYGGAPFTLAPIVPVSTALAAPAAAPPPAAAQPAPAAVAAAPPKPAPAAAVAPPAAQPTKPAPSLSAADAGSTSGLEDDPLPADALVAAAAPVAPRGAESPPAAAAAPPKPAVPPQAPPAAASAAQPRPPAPQQPQQPPQQPQFAPPPGPSLHPSALDLVAVLPRESGRPEALFRMPDGALVRAGLGAVIGGWRLESATPTSAQLFNGQDRIIVRLPGR